MGSWCRLLLALPMIEHSLFLDSECFLQVDARVLPAPALKYAAEFGVPREGSWNLKTLRFQESASIAAYGVACFAPERFYGSPGPEGFPVSFQAVYTLSGNLFCLPQICCWSCQQVGHSKIGPLNNSTRCQRIAFTSVWSSVKTSCAKTVFPSSPTYVSHDNPKQSYLLLTFLVCTCCPMTDHTSNTTDSPAQ